MESHFSPERFGLDSADPQKESAELPKLDTSPEVSVVPETGPERELREHWELIDRQIDSVIGYVSLVEDIEGAELHGESADEALERGFDKIMKDQGWQRLPDELSALEKENDELLEEFCEAPESESEPDRTEEDSQRLKEDLLNRAKKNGDKIRRLRKDPNLLFANEMAGLKNDLLKKRKEVDGLREQKINDWPFWEDSHPEFGPDDADPDFGTFAVRLNVGPGKLRKSLGVSFGGTPIFVVGAADRHQEGVAVHETIHTMMHDHYRNVTLLLLQKFDLALASVEKLHISDAERFREKIGTLEDVFAASKDELVANVPYLEKKLLDPLVEPKFNGNLMESGNVYGEDSFFDESYSTAAIELKGYIGTLRHHRDKILEDLETAEGGEVLEIARSLQALVGHCSRLEREIVKMQRGMERGIVAAELMGSEMQGRMMAYFMVSDPGQYKNSLRFLERQPGGEGVREKGPQIDGMVAFQKTGLVLPELLEAVSSSGGDDWTERMRNKYAAWTPEQLLGRCLFTGVASEKMPTDKFGEQLRRQVDFLWAMDILVPPEKLAEVKREYCRNKLDRVLARDEWVDSFRDFLSGEHNQDMRIEAAEQISQGIREFLKTGEYISIGPAYWRLRGMVKKAVMLGLVEELTLSEQEMDRLPPYFIHID
ncbi:hypothetical protein COY93_04445 [Candidatus Uhrbacteria bacterium CG_4_10_14_0_8_um_filter_58_22]|uniref:Uncharacterized protein n=1 Tax=Candidatus Uhrbacteria bacterium CG_4_10_14_0_8_um_filter_58_22 TaxID=1975029 RepID=A0A2M7Q9U7_9BACT|nr:MAG: hypothetical protein COY93_04445 [Candidatus Uhrbacteria bacterium CG_4_10_14_0_8_um_filter_58_22]